MPSSRILGVGYSLPDDVLPNSFFAERNPYYLYDTHGKPLRDTHGTLMEKHLDAEGIFQVTGIRERRKIAADEDVHHLAARAAHQALVHARTNPCDLEGIIVASVTNRQRFPCVADRVKGMLGATHAHYCFDIAAACAAFPYALDLADKHVRDTGKPCLAVAAEAVTRLTDYEGRDINSTLFGDGAGAALVGPPSSQCGGVMGFAFHTDPNDLIAQDDEGHLRMPEGGAVLRYAIRGMHALTQELHATLGWAADDVALYIPHQANGRIIEGYRKKLGVGPERVLNIIQEYGNMSAATCAVGLAQAIASKLVGAGDKVILASVGSGFKISAAALVL